MARLRVSKEFHFDAAHRLPDYHGSCERLHGHTWRLLVTVEGVLGKDGMVIDFAELKRVAMEQVVSVLDHSYLNDLLPNPSAEHVAIWAWERLAQALHVPLVEVTVWETATSSASYCGAVIDRPHPSRERSHR